MEEIKCYVMINNEIFNLQSSILMNYAMVTLGECVKSAPNSMRIECATAKDFNAVNDNTILYFV